MNSSTSKQDMGWLPAGMLVLLIALVTSAPAMGSSLTGDPIRNLNKSIAQNEADSAQILKTLGRDKAPDSATSADTRKKLRVQLIPAKKAKKSRASRA